MWSAACRLVLAQQMFDRGAVEVRGDMRRRAQQRVVHAVAQAAAEPVADRYAEAFFGAAEDFGREVGGEGFAEQIFAAAAAEEQRLGQTIGQGDEVVIEEWGADLERASTMEAESTFQSTSPGR